MLSARRTPRPSENIARTAAASRARPCMRPKAFARHDASAARTSGWRTLAHAADSRSRRRHASSHVNHNAARRAFGG